jgi:hypothetical protein
MNNQFWIKFKESNGNLHIRPKGPLNGSSACALLRFLHNHYEGTGRVFIETRDLDEIHPFGCQTFQGRLNRQRIPADRIYFKGEKGFKLAPEGSRVLIVNAERARQCKGPCRECTQSEVRSPMLRLVKKKN